MDSTQAYDLGYSNGVDNWYNNPYDSSSEDYYEYEDGFFDRSYYEEDY